MKRIIEDDSVSGLESLLGKIITVFSCRYIYSGKLSGVNEDCILLTDCGIVYDTGSFVEKSWSDYQKLPNDWYIAKSSIESWGLLK
jgi:hypothetical protein